jgi:hypothetical protein
VTHVDSVASAEPAVVAGDVAIRKLGGPATAARDTDDARACITIEVPELAPWRVRVDFLVFIESESESLEYEYVPCGCGLERPISIAAANADPDSVGASWATAWSRFAKLGETYWHQAELALRFQRGELADVRRALVSGRAHKYHPLLVADYRARRVKRGRIQDMAAAFNVDRTIIWRELRKAAGEGLISEDELETRGPTKTRTPRA